MQSEFFQNCLKETPSMVALIFFVRKVLSETGK
jgi:hypothetical protein